MIYGASNKAGKAFAYFLMSRGFNLILIERDSESIKDLETQLRKMLPDMNTVIIRAVLNKFDQESITKSVGEFVTFPVKMLVNCKSSKKTQNKKERDPVEYEDRKKVILRESTFISTDAQVKKILEAEDQITSFEVTTRAEVHYNGKENIEGYASLVNMFLRTMLMTSKQPCIINVNNVDGAIEDLKMEDGKIFYHATL